MILFGSLALSDTEVHLGPILTHCTIPLVVVIIDVIALFCCYGPSGLLSLRQQVMGTGVLDKSAFVLLALITMLIKELSNRITRSNHPTPQLTLSRYPLTSGLKKVHTCPQ